MDYDYYSWIIYQSTGRWTIHLHFRIVLQWYCKWWWNTVEMIRCCWYFSFGSFVLFVLLYCCVIEFVIDEGIISPADLLIEAFFSIKPIVVRLVTSHGQHPKLCELIPFDYFWFIHYFCNYQGPDLYAFIGFIGPDDDDINWLIILIFDY